MQKIKDLNQEIRKLSAFKAYHDRRMEIVTYIGASCNQKVLWFIGSLDHVFFFQTF